MVDIFLLVRYVFDEKLEQRYLLSLPDCIIIIEVVLLHREYVLIKNRSRINVHTIPTSPSSGYQLVEVRT